ncbi:MAG: hypothetical protein ACI9BW_001610 [Gammaproteobacteria bacterium]|jgi:hypothetical protein
MNRCAASTTVLLNHVLPPISGRHCVAKVGRDAQYSQRFTMARGGLKNPAQSGNIDAARAQLNCWHSMGRITIRGQRTNGFTLDLREAVTRSHLKIKTTRLLTSADLSAIFARSH